MLQSLRRDLLDDRARLMARNPAPWESGRLNPSSRVTDAFLHNMALGILSLERDAVFEVESAMRRILDGTYGICEATGKPIPEARLRVVPWTRYTKEALELAQKPAASTRRPRNKGTEKRSTSPNRHPAVKSNHPRRS